MNQKQATGRDKTRGMGLGHGQNKCTRMNAWTSKSVARLLKRGSVRTHKQSGDTVTSRRN
eukprot:13718182-Alexandrium_andersonii.AAC.1